MTTANDIITTSYQELGLYATNETLESQDAQLGLALLNRIISDWQNEYLFPWSITNFTGNLVQGVSAYQVGNGLAFGAARPQGVVYGPGQVSVTIAAVGVQADVVSAIEWNMIESVNPGTGVPNTVYYDPQYPVGILNFAPTPNGNGTAVIPFMYEFVSFATLTTAYTFSPGVYDCLVHNLSVYAKPYFATANLDPNIAALAVSTKNYLRYSNRSSRALLRRDIGRPASPQASQPPPPVAT